MVWQRLKFPSYAENGINITHSPRSRKAGIALFWWHYLGLWRPLFAFHEYQTTCPRLRVPHRTPRSRPEWARSFIPLLPLLPLRAAEQQPWQQRQHLSRLFPRGRSHQDKPKVTRNTAFSAEQELLLLRHSTKIPGCILPGRSPFSQRLLETKSYQNSHSNAAQMTHYSPKNNNGEISN